MDPFFLHRRDRFFWCSFFYWKRWNNNLIICKLKSRRGRGQLLMQEIKRVPPKVARRRFHRHARRRRWTKRTLSKERQVRKRQSEKTVSTTFNKPDKGAENSSTTIIIIIKKLSLLIDARRRWGEMTTTTIRVTILRTDRIGLQFRFIPA